MQNAEALERDTRNAKIMLGVFGVFTLLFACGGGAIVGIAGYGSESDGVTAAMALFGPGCCSISGLLVAVIAMFAFPTNKTAQLIAPIVAGVLGGFVGGVGIFVFFAAIWPSL